MGIGAFFTPDEKKVTFEEKQEKESETKKQDVLNTLYGREPVYYDAKANPDIDAFRGSKIKGIPSKPEYDEFITQIKTLITSIVKAIEDKKLLPDNREAYVDVEKVWQDLNNRITDPDLLSADVVFPYFENGKRYFEEIYYNIMVNSNKTSTKELIASLHVCGVLDVCGSGAFTKIEAIVKSLQNPGLTIEDHFYQAVENVVESKITAFYINHILGKWELATIGNEIHYVNLMLDHLIDLRVLPITLKHRSDPDAFTLPPIPDPLLENLRKLISENPEIIDDVIRALTNKYYSMMQDVSTYHEATHFIGKITSGKEPKLFELKFRELFDLYEKDDQNNYILDETALSTTDIKPLDQIKATSGSPTTIKTTTQIKETLKIPLLLKLCEKKIIPPNNLLNYLITKNILNPVAVQFLHGAKADFNIPFGGITALSYAVNAGQTDVVKALLEVKAKGSAGLYFDPEQKQYRHLVPSHWLNDEIKPTTTPFDFGVWNSIPTEEFRNVLFRLLNELSEVSIEDLLFYGINPHKIAAITQGEQYALALGKLYCVTSQFAVS